jgi:hypothetical protein
MKFSKVIKQAKFATVNTTQDHKDAYDISNLLRWFVLYVSRNCISFHLPPATRLKNYTIANTTAVGNFTDAPFRTAVPNSQHETDLEFQINRKLLFPILKEKPQGLRVESSIVCTIRDIPFPEVEVIIGH